MKYLVAFGCSHTHGSMLDGINGSSEYNVRNGFPGILAKRYGYQLYNISKPGGSNQYIHRSVVEFLTKHYDPMHEYIFLINWTSRFRIELRYNEESINRHVSLGDFTDYKSVPFTVGSDPALFSDKYICKLLNYTPLLINAELEAERWATWAYALQNTLEYMNIPYLMSNTCEALPHTSDNFMVCNKLDTKKYIEPFDTPSSMLNYLQDKGIPKTPCYHFREEGHKLWADRLETRLRNLNYVK